MKILLCFSSLEAPGEEEKEEEEEIS